MRTVDVMIETTKGDRCKYKFDKKKERFRLKKILPAGLSFPYDFGFIPGTKAEDGDPVDILIISEESFLAGSIVECAIIGVIKANQSSNGKMIRNDRIIGVPVAALGKDDLAIEDISKNKIEEIENFFISYNKMEDKEFQPLGLSGAKEAWKLIRHKK